MDPGQLAAGIGNIMRKSREPALPQRRCASAGTAVIPRHADEGDIHG